MKIAVSPAASLESGHALFRAGLHAGFYTGLSGDDLAGRFRDAADHDIADHDDTADDVVGHEGRAAHDAAPPARAPEAWVVFSGQTDLPWLRWLKPGFRHCFVVMHDGTHWLTVDPMLHRMDIHVHRDLPLGFDLPRWLEKRGQLVLPAAIDLNRCHPAPWRPFTCTEAVKRVLGLHARLVLTPWQLYRHLGGAARDARRGKGATGRPHSHLLQKETPAWAA